jgi:hypothetical protein
LSFLSTPLKIRPETHKEKPNNLISKTLKFENKNPRNMGETIATFMSF